MVCIHQIIYFINVAYFYYYSLHGPWWRKRRRRRRKPGEGKKKRKNKKTGGGGEEPPSKLAFQMNNQTFHSKVEMERYRRQGFFYFKLNILILSGRCWTHAFGICLSNASALQVLDEFTWETKKAFYFYRKIIICNLAEYCLILHL